MIFFLFLQDAYLHSQEQDYIESLNSLGIKVNDKHSDTIASHVALHCLVSLSRGV